ncbi:Carboxymuconolactone decarboxylase family protein [Oceanobacillus oncorhynchi]|uniref:Carboxymuconolactone decarboxylase family protein n=1 Tax=Oceanobacillus oncorhynchi TaxID=545501 RepID=A0A0A1MBI4_9BACI|nr:Carboxymuconolactone decarboxylase family protein [Oceanobacillus oncorhynchi]
MQSLVADPKINVGVGNVTFEPGCRNNWHIHHDGYQLLLVTGGEGWYQEEGKTAQFLKPGDVVVTHLNDDVLFGEVWSRESELSPRDRSMITCASLMTQGVPQLEAHLKMAKQNGVTKEEIVELITHVAFYTGWPKAWSAFNLAKEIFDEA